MLPHMRTISLEERFQFFFLECTGYRFSLGRHTLLISRQNPF
jgi:hypothetical protein